MLADFNMDPSDCGLLRGPALAAVARSKATANANRADDMNEMQVRSQRRAERGSPLDKRTRRRRASMRTESSAPALAPTASPIPRRSEVKTHDRFMGIGQVLTN